MLQLQPPLRPHLRPHLQAHLPVRRAAALQRIQVSEVPRPGRWSRKPVMPQLPALARPPAAPRGRSRTGAIVLAALPDALQTLAAVPGLRGLEEQADESLVQSGQVLPMVQQWMELRREAAKENATVNKMLASIGTVHKEVTVLSLRGPGTQSVSHEVYSTGKWLEGQVAHDARCLGGRYTYDAMAGSQGISQD